MTYYDTIKEGELTPLHDGGYSTDSTTAAALSTKKRTSSVIVRAVMVGTTVAVGALLLMTGPSMRTMTSSSNVDGMVVVSSTATQDNSGSGCAPATGTFSGLSCKDNNGNCAVAGGSWGGYAKIDHFETCYVSQNGYCWSRSQEVDNPGYGSFFTRCDPDGYNDGDFGYDNDGIWHVATPLWDGSCGNPCREFF